MHVNILLRSGIRLPDLGSEFFLRYSKNHSRIETAFAPHYPQGSRRLHPAPAQGVWRFYTLENAVWFHSTHSRGRS